MGQRAWTRDPAKARRSGSTFHSAALEAAGMTTEPSLRLIRFLLVEDDEDHANLVLMALHQNRVVNEVAHVRNGEECRSFLRREAPYEKAQRRDVVLLDLKLPRMDGHEVLDAIKSDESLKRIPVVVLTTSETEIDRVRAYDANVNSFLVKPLDFGQFRQMIENLELYWAVWNRPPI
jgi:CheY-like chemotaxis protein